MKHRFGLFTFAVVIIFGILLYLVWIYTLLGHNPYALSPTLQLLKSLHHKNISELQPVPQDLKLFSLSMSISEMNVLLTLLEVFIHTMDKYNLTYVMDGGSLLGTYRHHGLIPWDDDLDVMAEISQKVKIKNALESLSPHYVMIEYDNRLKLFSRDDSTQKFKYKSWRWPFLDIFWFNDTGTHIHVLFDGYMIKREDFYPLKKRPFGYLSVYAPCNVSAVLKGGKIDWNMCVTKAYNHKKEMWAAGGQISIPCKKLQQYYPFVRREFHKDKAVEYLEANNRTISVFEDHHSSVQQT